MTREELARKIHWQTIIWIMGFVNVGAMLPQLYKIIVNWNVENISIEMFFVYLLIQIAFSLEGFFKRNKMLMVCLGISAIVSMVIIVLILYIQHS